MKTGIVSAVATVTSLLLASSALEAADAPPLHIEMPALPLAEAIQVVARQASVNILVDPRLVAGRQAPAISRELSVDQALTALLAGTGLTPRFVDEKTITLVADAPRSGRSLSFTDGMLRLAQGMPGAGAVGGDAQHQEDGLEEVLVTGEVEFRHDGIQSASKMPQSVKDTPQTVKVVTQDLIEFADIRNFEDFDRVDASSGSTHSGYRVPRNYFRGFATQSVNAIKVDGYRMIGYVELDLAPFERIEVVKGATSTLYGQNPIGGTLNAVSKKPTREFGGEFSLETGSFDRYRAEADVHGGMSADGRWSYRLIGAYETEDSYLDFVYDRMLVLAPSVAFDVGEDTSLGFRAIYQRNTFMPYGGFAAQFLGTSTADPAQLIPENFRIPAVPDSRSSSSPTDSASSEIVIAQASIDHRMGGWTLRGNLQYNEELDGDPDVATIVQGTNAAGLTTTIPFREKNPNHVYSAEVNLYGNVDLFGREHTLFFGTDYAKLTTDHLVMTSFLSGLASGFSILDPDYDLIRIDRPEDFSSYETEHGEQSMYGLTAQAVLRPSDRLTLSLGGRYSYDEIESELACCEIGIAPDPLVRREYEKFTYQAGVTYALTRDVNAYAGYGTTYEPQLGYVAEGEPIEPQEGTSYEVGFKGQLPGRRVSYSVALFHMDRTNISQAIIGEPYVIPVGTQASDGIELDFQGEIRKGWQVFGSLALMDPRYTEGEHEGAQPTAAPKRGASLFTSYEIQGGAARGLGFGGGVVYKGGRDTTDFRYGAHTPITFLGDFAEVDLRMFYVRPSWKFNLSVTNALDERHHSLVFERLTAGMVINRPRTVTASVSYQF